MGDDAWRAVVPADDVAGPPWPCHDVGGTLLRLVRDAEGGIHAVGAGCPHLGSPLTHAPVDGDVLSCPHHWYEFRVSDGENVFPGYADTRLPVYPVRVIDDVVQVRVPEAS